MLNSIFSSQNETPRDNCNNSPIVYTKNNINSINSKRNQDNKNMSTKEKIKEMSFKKSDMYNASNNQNSININNINKNKTKKIIENENINNKIINSNPYINIKPQAHLETVLETVNENNESEHNNIALNNNYNTNYKEISTNVKIKKTEYIINNEQKNLESENKINYSENITSSVLGTLVVNNTKKSSLFLSKYEKTY